MSDYDEEADAMTTPAAIEAALTDSVDAKPAPEPKPEPEPAPAPEPEPTPAPVCNAVIEEVDGTHSDVWIPDLQPRQRVAYLNGQEYHHVHDAADGRWIYRRRA